MHPARLIPAAVGRQRPRVDPQREGAARGRRPQGRRRLGRPDRRWPTPGSGCPAEACDCSSLTTQRACPTASLGGRVLAAPLPIEQGEASCRRLLERAGALGRTKLLVVLLSGSASALLAAPTQPHPQDIRATTTRALLKAGATIHQLSAVARLLAAAGAARPRPRRAARSAGGHLVLSDVGGDLIPDVASGHTVPSPTTAAPDALGVLACLGLLDAVRGRGRIPARGGGGQRRRRAGRSARASTSSPATGPRSARARTLSRRPRLRTIRPRRPCRRGPRPRQRCSRTSPKPSSRDSRTPSSAAAGPRCRSGAPGTRRVQPRARARRRAQALRPAAGGCGPGGRHWPTSTVSRRQPGSDRLRPPWRERGRRDRPAAALDDNASGTALAATGDAILTGPTGTNVCDVVIVLTA
jgi:hypothetical protein